MSCGFSWRAFAPPPGVEEALLSQRVYVTRNHLAAQCTGGFNDTARAVHRWRRGTAALCDANNFPLYMSSEAECVEQAADSSQRRLPGFSTDAQRCSAAGCIAATSLRRLPVPLLARFAAARAGVLPPHPHLVYARDAVLDIGVRTATETYVPACAPRFQRLARVVQAPNVSVPPQNVPKPKGASFDKFLALPYGPSYSVAALVRDCRAGGQPRGGACPIPRYARVFSMPQMHFTALFHFMIEVWPRIGPWVAEIRADRGLKVHADPYGDGKGWQARFFSLIGIPRSQLVAGVVFADEVVVPRVGYSHNPHLNLWGLSALRSDIEARHAPPRVAEGVGAGTGRSKVLLLLRRRAGPMRRRSDDSVFGDNFVVELERVLPRHRVRVFDTDGDLVLAACLPCQVRLFQRADVVLGSHGAGLSHLLWARRGAVVLERTRPVDSLIYLELATVLGLKYFPVPRSLGVGAPLVARVAQLVQLGESVP
jgi:hypothetical protein